MSRWQRLPQTFLSFADWTTLDPARLRLRIKLLSPLPTFVQWYIVVCPPGPRDAVPVPTSALMQVPWSLACNFSVVAEIRSDIVPPGLISHPLRTRFSDQQRPFPDTSHPTLPLLPSPTPVLWFVWFVVLVLVLFSHRPSSLPCVGYEFWSPVWSRLDIVLNPPFLYHPPTLIRNADDNSRCMNHSTTTVYQTKKPNKPSSAVVTGLCLYAVLISGPHHHLLFTFTCRTLASRCSSPSFSTSVFTALCTRNLILPSRILSTLRRIGLGRQLQQLPHGTCLTFILTGHSSYRKGNQPPPAFIAEPYRSSHDPSRLITKISFNSFSPLVPAATTSVYLAQVLTFIFSFLPGGSGRT